MRKNSPFAVDVTPNWHGLVDCILRRGTPARVHHIELFLDGEVKVDICKRFGLLDGLDQDDSFFAQRREIRIQRFLGYDFVRCSLDGFKMPLHNAVTDDTAALARFGGRTYRDEHVGPVTNREQFDAYPWPDPAQCGTRSLEWYSENLPDDMCIIASGGFAHFCEYLSWLPGYETLCYLLYDDRDLVAAITAKLLDIFEKEVRRYVEFDRVKIIWGSDDMGFKNGLLFSAADMREFVLPGHKRMAELSHAAGRPYLLHACGKLTDIMTDLIEDVRIDAKHSFEDTIEDVVEDKRLYGDRIALLGGIDVDFLCRADEAAIRARVRRTLERCMPGGGYCLGSGNSVANYIPVNHYLAMVDEGRRWRP